MTDRDGSIVGAVETFRPIGEEILLPEGMEEQYTYADIIGKSQPMKRIFSMLPDVAASEANVLICGESGTGKDLFARTIHNHSPRAKQPFIAVNCSALAETLLESELFGHEKGAYTGATESKPGRFELAHRGTIFLDEIGELKPELQIKLLRVLEQREFERVGGNRSYQMEARIISATNRDLYQALKKGTFREDFYYRLRTVPLTIPPLRERREDIPLLVDHFIKKMNKRYKKRVHSVAPEVIDFFNGYNWPGNVRELERTLEYAYVFVKGPVILPQNLPGKEDFKLTQAMPSADSHTPSGTLGRERILWALSRTGGKRNEAAELLEISRTSLWRRMKEFGLS